MEVGRKRGTLLIDTVSAKPVSKYCEIAETSI
jgi:hypothetical protein